MQGAFVHPVAATSDSAVRQLPQLSNSATAQTLPTLYWLVHFVVHLLTKPLLQYSQPSLVMNYYQLHTVRSMSRLILLDWL